MKLNNFLRIFVCIVLVCVLVFNISPLRAQALEPVSTAIGIGVAACLLLGTAGIIFNPTSNAQIEAIGNSMQTYLYQWGTSAEKLDDVDEFFGGLTLYEGSPDDDDDDDDDGFTPHKREFKILNAIKTGIAAWLIAIASGSIEVEAPASDFTTFDSWSKNLTYEFDGVAHDVSVTNDSDFILPVYVTNPNVPTSASLYIFSSSGTIILDGVKKSYNGGWNRTDNFVYYCHFITSFNITEHTFSGFYYLGPNSGPFDLSCGDIYNSDMPAVPVLPDTYVGDIPDGIKDGSITSDNLELPDFIGYDAFLADNSDLASSVTGVLQNVANGTTSYDDYMSMVQPVPDPDPAPGTDPDEPIIPAPDLDNAPLSDLDVNVFFDTLSDIIFAPFKWIWEKLDTKLDTLMPPEFDFDRLIEIITAPFRWIWEKIETVILPAIRAIPDAIADVVTSLQTLGDSLIDKMTEIGAQTKAAIESLVVPDKDYLTDKVNALCAEFAFADSIVRTGQALYSGLANITTEPPVIYIDLGATRGDYNIGGRVPFIDLRWYAEYKPTVDIMLSAFLWICFAWRMLLKLPGIISGMPGDFVAGSAHNMGLTDMLPSRSADLERQRFELRQSIWKGRNK